MENNSLIPISIIDKISDGITLSDTSGHFEIFNEKMQEITGYTLEEANNHGDFSNLIYPGQEDRAQALSRLSDIRRGQAYRDIETVIRAKDGAKKILLVSTSLIQYKNRDMFLSVFHDITESSKVEHELRESERKVRAILDQTFQFIGLMTPDGILIDANKSALDLAGIQAVSVLGKPFWQTPWWTHSQELQERLRQAIISVAQGEFVRFEATHVDKNGALHYVDFSLKPVKNESGKVVFMIPEGRDITENRKAQEALIEAYKEVKRTGEVLVQSEKLAALGRFALGVAHEIKNPLGIILGGVESLEVKFKKAKRSDKDAVGTIKKIKASIFRADNIVRRLLNFARPSELQIKKVKPEYLINDVLDLVKYEISSVKIDIITEFTPDIFIEVDPSHMQQVFFNLITNAIEAMPDGGLINIKTYRIGQDKDYLYKSGCVIEIRDTGKGIPKENLPRMFEPFFTTKRKSKGTGLGLSIAKNIVEGHKGEIKIESQPGAGTTVKVILP